MSSRLVARRTVNPALRAFLIWRCTGLCRALHAASVPPASGQCHVGAGAQLEIFCPLGTRQLDGLIDQLSRRAVVVGEQRSGVTEWYANKPPASEGAAQAAERQQTADRAAGIGEGERDGLVAVDLSQQFQPGRLAGEGSGASAARVGPPVGLACRDHTP